MNDQMKITEKVFYFEFKEKEYYATIDKSCCLIYCSTKSEEVLCLDLGVSTVESKILYVVHQAMIALEYIKTEMPGDIISGSALKFPGEGKPPKPS